MGYSGSPDEIRVVIAAEIDRALAAMREMSAGVRAASEQSSHSLTGMGEVSGKVERKMEHLAMAVGFSVGAMATSSGDAIEKIVHAATGLAFAFGPVQGGIGLAIGSIITMFHDLSKEADESAKHVANAFTGYTVQSLKVAQAAARAYSDAILAEIQSFESIVTTGGKAGENVPKELLDAYSASLSKVTALTDALRAAQKAAADAAGKDMTKMADEVDQALGKVLDDLREFQAEQAHVNLLMRITSQLSAQAQSAIDAFTASARAKFFSTAEAAQKLRDQLRDIVHDLTIALDPTNFHVDLSEWNAQQKELLAQWRSTFNALPLIARRAMTDVVQSGQSMASFWKFAAQEMAAATVELIWDSVAQWAAAELVKHNITRASVLKRVALETWAATTTVALALWAAAKFLIIKAIEAAAAAWASAASVPVIGWALAPAVAIATLAGVLALGSQLASAAGGYDIPAGVNPVTQLHAEEMVLPKEYANVIRALADRTGGAGGNTYHIYAMDGADVERVLNRHAGVVARAAQRGAKNGALDSGIGRSARRV